jgi:hypothetical protein
MNDSFIRLTRHKISDRETCKALNAGYGWMANTQSTHIVPSRGSLHRLVDIGCASSLLRIGHSTVELRVARRKRDKGRQSGRPGQ